MSRFVSMASFYPNIVDCRMIQLELEFDRLTQNQLKKFASQFFEKIVSLMQQDFYLYWEWGNRHTIAENILNKIKESTTFFDFSFEGYVFSETVYNAKTFRQYNRFLEEISNTGGSNPLSIDYYDYLQPFKSAITHAAQPDEIKNILLQIFNEPKKKKTGRWDIYDAVFLFNSWPHWNDPSQFKGTISLRIAAQCLGVYLVEFSEAIASLVRNIAEEYSTVSTRITLSPLSLPGPSCGHMLYFGHRAIRDITVDQDLTDQEWFRRHYIQGAEWFNLLSLIQSKRLLGNQSLRSHTNVFIERTSTGSTVVRSRKNILETDIPELISIKKTLYPVLYPGNSTIALGKLFDPQYRHYTTKPRGEWEYVPVFAEEITVLSDSVVFQHCGNIDK